MTGDEPYRIGVIGVGHWASNFADAMDDLPLQYDRALDIVPYAERRDALDDLGIDSDGYDRIAPDADLPEQFFADLDVVQIASPVAYHTDQTLDAIAAADDAVIVPEKAYGAGMEPYKTVKAEAEQEGVTVWPNLHYRQKQPTRWLDAHIDEQVDAHGPVETVEAAFVEEADVTDRERSWIFAPEHGGIAMDWIHPREVLIEACDAAFDEVLAAEGYVTEDYADGAPTAARMEHTLSGDMFADDAVMTERIGKGFPDGATHKVLSLVHTDGTQVDLVYQSADLERRGNDRGEIVQYPSDAATTRTVLTGATPYELLAYEIVDARRTGTAPFTWSAQEEAYRVTATVQEQLEDGSPVRDKDAIDAFLDAAHDVGA